MKRVFLALTVCVGVMALHSCNGGQEKTAPATDETAKPQAEVVKDVAPDGPSIIAKNDCLTCHKIDEKLIGPSYKEVAAKYKGQADAYKTLAEKVIKGGSGVWGDVAMTAHPNLSKEDAETVAKYVLQQ